ncbi:MAG: hypothetical protein AAGM22_13875, partial [Acidobacteriota bacterium]
MVSCKTHTAGRSAPRSEGRRRGRASTLCGLLVSAVVTLLVGCGEAAPPPPPFFVELESTPDFVHRHGGTGELSFPEVMGAGGALVD